MLENLRIGAVSEVDRNPLLFPFFDHARIELEHQVANPVSLERKRNIPSADPEATNDDMIGRPRFLTIELPDCALPGTLGCEASDDPARGQPSAGSNHQRSQDHGGHGTGDQELIPVVGDQPEMKGLFQDDERELPNLREGQPGDDRDRNRQSPQDGGGARDHELAENHERDDREDQTQVAGNEEGIDQHADGDEEETVEAVPQGTDLAEDLVAVLGRGQDEAGQEAAQRQGESRLGADPGDSQKSNQHRNDEELLAARLHDAPDQSREGVAGAQEDQNENGKRQTDRFQDLAPAVLRRSEMWNQDHHGHDRQVLEDQDAQTDSTMQRIDLVPIEQDLDDHGRTAERDQEGDNQRKPGVEAGQPQREHYNGDRHQDLGGARDEYDLANLRQLPNRELQPDREQKEHDAHFREQPHGRDVGDEFQPAWPHQHASDQKTDDRRLADQVKHVHDDRADRIDEHQVSEDREVLHRISQS